MTNDPSADSTSSPSREPTRAEIILALLIALAGFGLRIAHPARLAVEHFDEGVYASNLFFHDKAGGGHYPDQYLYAPPLLPFLIECSMIVFGTSNAAAMAVNIAAGTLTIPVLWWLGRRWFGPTAGVSAATLAALNDAHIFFSRTALTDVLLCFFLVCAVYFIHEALTTRRRLALFATICAAGATTSLGWWTKYNGWLPLAIGLAGLVPWKLLGDMKAPAAGQSRWRSMRIGASQLLPALARWLSVALVAFLIWLPWLSNLQEKGGYSAVNANHRGYVLGLAEWTRTFAAQAGKLAILDGLPTGCSLLAVFAVSIVMLRMENRRFTWNMLLKNDVTFFTLPVAVLVWVTGSASVFLVMLGGAGAFLGLVRPFSRHSTSPDNETSRRLLDAAPGTLAAWMVTAWFVGLLATIPLYMWYPRLLLPLLVASWLGAGILVDTLMGLIRSQAGQRLAVDLGTRPLLAGKYPAALAIGRFRPVFILALGVAIVLAAQQRSPLAQGVPGWESRTSIANIAPAIVNDACRDAGLDPQAPFKKLVIYSYGEPALVFNLRLAGAEFVNP
ncbi:MAG TPA: glycosyltransferase family 39 protein, partial [Planctomycetaceae bacterium]